MTILNRFKNFFATQQPFVDDIKKVEREVDVTAGEIYDILRNRVWIAFVETTKERLYFTRQHLETCQSRQEVCKLQGQAEELRAILEFTENLITSIKPIKGNEDV